MMKVNRPINECRCDNCKKYSDCFDKGVFDDDTGLDFCINYVDVDYSDDFDDESFDEINLY